MFLRIKVESDESGIHLNQTEHIEKLLNKYGMTDCKPEKIPRLYQARTDSSNEITEKYDTDKY